MTTMPTAVVPETNAGEGWLILQVALPRLARRLERAHAWLDRYTPEHFVEAADGLRGLSGAEGLALLAAIPPDRREAALERIELDVEDRQGLRALAERLGDPEDDRTPAAGLVRMVPSVGRAALEVPGDDQRGVAALLVLAEQAYLRGELHSARESAQRGLDRLRAGGVSGDRKLEGDALNLLGLAYAELGDLHRAIGFHEQQLAIAREIGDRQGEGNALGNLGIAYDNLGQVGRAIDFHERDLKIAWEIGDRQSEGKALGNLGVAYKNLGQVERAIDFLEQALAIAREIGDRQSEVKALGNLGVAYRNLSQVGRAIVFLEWQLAIAREIGNRQDEGNALANLGIAYANLGQVERAIDFLEQALAIAREIGDRQSEANTCWNMGLALEELGRVAEAIPWMERCVDFLREIGHPDTEKDAAAIEALRVRLAEQGQG